MGSRRTSSLSALPHPASLLLLTEGTYLSSDAGCARFRLDFCCSKKSLRASHLRYEHQHLARFACACRDTRVRGAWKSWKDRAGLVHREGVWSSIEVVRREGCCWCSRLMWYRQVPNGRASRTNHAAWTELGDYNSLQHALTHLLRLGGLTNEVGVQAEMGDDGPWWMVARKREESWRTLPHRKRVHLTELPCWVRCKSYGRLR